MFSQFQLKTGMAEATSPIQNNNFNKARNEAIFLAQAKIINREVVKILDPRTYSFFKKEIQKLLTSKINSYFFSVLISKENNDDGNFSIKLEGTYDPKKIITSFEVAGIPTKDDEEINIILIERNPTSHSLKNHLERIYFKVLKYIPLSKNSENDALKEISPSVYFNQVPTAKILLFVDWKADLSAKNGIKDHITGYLRGIKNPYVNSNFSLKFLGEDDTSKNTEKLTYLSDINRNTLKARKISLFDIDKTYITIKGFRNPIDKPNLTNFIFNNLKDLFTSFQPEKGDKEGLSFSIQIPKLNSWLNLVNSRTKEFKLRINSINDSFVELQYINNVFVKEKELKSNFTESEDVYLSENESNDSFYEYNILPAHRNVYGTVTGLDDLDIYKTYSDETIESLLIEKISDKKFFSMRIKLYDGNHNLIKNILIPSNNKNVFEYKDLSLNKNYNQLYIIISNPSNAVSFNIGAAKKIQYRLRVNNY